MEKYILFNTNSLNGVIDELIKNSKKTDVNSIKRYIPSGMGCCELTEKDYEIPEESYDEKIVLPEYDFIQDNKMCLELAKLLISRKGKKESPLLSKEEIERVLINRSNNTVNKKVFYALTDLRTDMTGVDLSGLYIHGLDFRGLTNLVIDLDKVKDKDLVNVNFAGVTLKGNLDNAKLYYTRFRGCLGLPHLDPQKIKHKSMMCTCLGGVKVVGSFDGVKIDNCDFRGVRGKVVINPQTIYGKKLDGLILDSCFIQGEDGAEASFKGCTIDYCDFKGVKNKVTINLNDLVSHKSYTSFIPDKEKLVKISHTDLSDVILKGDFFRSELKDLLRTCYTCWYYTSPNYSAPAEVLSGGFEGIGPHFNWIELEYIDDYEREDVTIDVNVIDRSPLTIIKSENRERVRDRIKSFFHKNEKK